MTSFRGSLEISRFRPSHFKLTTTTAQFTFYNCKLHFTAAEIVITTGVDLLEILDGQTKILGGGGKNFKYMHVRFSIIGGNVPGLPPQSLRLCQLHVKICPA